VSRIEVPNSLASSDVSDRGLERPRDRSERPRDEHSFSKNWSGEGISCRTNLV
jgi:hypothetical protein